MSNFENHLFEDLMREHGDELAALHRPAARRRVPRTMWATAGVLGVAGAVTLAVTIADTGTPAYAVTGDPHGTITVSLRDLTGVSGANAKLRRMGVPAVAVPMRSDCASTVAPDTRSVTFGRGGGASLGTGGTGFVTFAASMIPAGDTLVLAAQQSDKSVTMGMVMIRGQAPACLKAPLATAPAGNSGAEAGASGETETGAGGSGSSAPARR